MAAKQAVKRTPSKTPGRKPAKTLPEVFARQAIADINAVIKTQKKLDLDLRKIEKTIKKLLGHQYRF